VHQHLVHMRRIESRMGRRDVWRDKGVLARGGRSFEPARRGVER
jgi:hypothetical protein